MTKLKLSKIKSIDCPLSVEFLKLCDADGFIEKLRQCKVHIPGRNAFRNTEG